MRKHIPSSEHCLINMHQEADMGRVYIPILKSNPRLKYYMELNILPHESL